MNKKIAIGLILGIAVFGGVGYFLYRRKNEGLAAYDQGDLHQALTNTSQPIIPQNSSSVSPADIAKATVTAAGAAKAIGSAVKSIIGNAGKDVVTTSLTDAAGNAAEGAAGEVLASGGTVDEALTAASTAGAQTVGGSAILGAGVALAAIAIVVLVANALGVFEPWDPHAGFQKLKLTRDLPQLNLKAGDIIDWIPNDLYDRVMANSPGSFEALMSFVDSHIKQIEDEQAARDQIQRNEQAAQKAEEDAAAAQEALRIAQLQAQQQQDAQARAAADQAIRDAQAAADAAAAQLVKAQQSNSEPVKQAIAKKATGNSATQFNGLGNNRKPIPLGSGFGKMGYSKILR